MEAELVSLGARLSLAGARATFVFSRRPPPWMATALAGARVGVRVLDFRRPAAAALAFTAMMEAARPSLVHFHFVRAYSPLVAIAKAVGARVVLHDHITLGQPTNPGASRARQDDVAVGARLQAGARGRAQRLRRSPDRGQPLRRRQRARDRVRATRSKLTVLENGIDLSRFGAADGASLRAELRAGAGHRIVGCVSRLAPEKGIDVLIRAMARVGRDALLVLAGDGPGVDDCRALAASLGLGDHVRFLGLRNDVERIYAAADVMVMPSLWDEAFGLVVVEAMAAGRPVVVTRSGAMPELVGGGARPRRPQARRGGDGRRHRSPARRRRLARAHGPVGARPRHRALRHVGVGRAPHGRVRGARPRARSDGAEGGMIARLQALFIKVLGACSPLVAGRLVSAALTFALPLVLARMLTPEEFGTYKQFFLIASTLQLTGQLGLTQSLLYFMPRGGKERGAYISQTFFSLAVLGVFFGAALWLATPIIGRWLGDGTLVSLRVPLVLFCGFMLAAAALESAIVSEGRMARAALAYVLTDGVRAAALILGAKYGGPAGLFWAAAATSAARVAALFFIVFNKTVPFAWPHLGLFKKQLAYALPFAGYSYLYVAQRYFSQYAVSSSFDAATFALFAVASFHMPVVDIVFTPLSDVMIVQIGKAQHANDARGHVARLERCRAEAGVDPVPRGGVRVAVRSDGAADALHAQVRRVGAAVHAGDARDSAVDPAARCALARRGRDALPVRVQRRAHRRITAALVLGGIHFFGLPGAIVGGIASAALARAGMMARGRRFLGVSWTQHASTGRRSGARRRGGGGVRAGVCGARAGLHGALGVVAARRGLRRDLPRASGRDRTGYFAAARRSRSATASHASSSGGDSTAMSVAPASSSACKVA